MKNIKVVCYEDADRGIYKYAIVSPNEGETRSLQRFIREKQINLDIKVEVKEVSIPVQVDTMQFGGDVHEIIVLALMKDGCLKIWSGHPDVNHDISGFLNWILFDKMVPLEEIETLSFYTKGLHERLTVTPYTLGGCGDEVTKMAISEQ